MFFFFVCAFHFFFLFTGKFCVARSLVTFARCFILSLFLLLFFGFLLVWHTKSGSGDVLVSVISTANRNVALLLLNGRHVKQEKRKFKIETYTLDVCACVHTKPRNGWRTIPIPVGEFDWCQTCFPFSFSFSRFYQYKQKVSNWQKKKNNNIKQNEKNQ